MSSRAGWRVTALVLLGLGMACRQAEPPAAVVERVPAVPATVLTIRAESGPPARALVYRIASDGRYVRIGDEIDRWRLFDLQAGSVSFVDDIARTYRTETLEQLLEKRRQQFRRPAPENAVRPEFVDTGERLDVAGQPARHFRITVGGYERDLWISEVPILDPAFMRLYYASEPLSEPFAAVMRPVFEELVKLEGFPVVDRARMPWGEDVLTHEERLIEVEQSEVPAGWLSIPEGYRDVSQEGAG